MAFALAEGFMFSRKQARLADGTRVHPRLAPVRVIQ
jgi:hypothetical protein